jgi:hypothetical protein
VDTVPDPLLLRISDSAGNRTQVIWVRSQELWPLDHRGGIRLVTIIIRDDVTSICVVANVVEGGGGRLIGLLPQYLRLGTEQTHNTSAGRGSNPGPQQ